ncbi:MAG: hypothetical protein KC620_06580 [Myxococcales bacterium]|nr:hypothetical protein [Myxococcales bacterium]
MIRRTLAIALGIAWASAAQATPRIDCQGQPAIKDAQADVVEVSTDKVGVVRVSNDPKSADVWSTADFCAAHGGIASFILPAPHPVDDDVEERAQGEVRPDEPRRPDSQPAGASFGGDDGDDGSATNGDDSDDASADGKTASASEDAAEAASDDDGADDDVKWAKAYKSMHGPPAYGCDQSPTNSAPSPAWAAALLVLGLCRRRRGAR